MASDDDDSELPWATSGWMDGDSLAPPCQAEDDVVGAIIDACKLAPGDDPPPFQTPTRKPRILP